MVKDQLLYILLNSVDNLLQLAYWTRQDSDRYINDIVYLQLHLNLHFHCLCLLHRIPRNCLTVAAATGS